MTTTLASPAPKTGSIGRPIPGVEVQARGGRRRRARRGRPDGLVDADDDDDDFDDDAGGSPGTDPGEIVVRGANLFCGYWPDGRDGPDADGWWATGDIAYADADGDLFLVDRLGELILVNGFNVYPHEVELVLDAHPGVAEAAVVGVPHPYTGQAVKAFVVRAPGADGHRRGPMLRHCERNLARFKCPTAIEFVAELPHSAIGKVRKARCGSREPAGGRVTRPAHPDHPGRLPPVRRGQGGARPGRRAGRRDVDARSTSTPTPSWQREYGDRVPVVLLDGKEHGYWRVEEDRLLRDLGRAARQWPYVLAGVAHLVWDWNGTLLDDLTSWSTATNASFASVGGPIGHRRRAPAATSAARSPTSTPTCSAGPVDAEEFARLDRLFHDAYRAGPDHLRAGRRRARRRSSAWPGTQSLLSMWFHDELVPAVDTYGLTGLFTRVDGLRPRSAAA